MSKKIVIPRAGPPSVLEIDQSSPIPEPQESQVLIQVKASGINFADM